MKALTARVGVLEVVQAGVADRADAEAHRFAGWAAMRALADINCGARLESNRAATEFLIRICKCLRCISTRTYKSYATLGAVA